jgi:hypothetical protein
MNPNLLDVRLQLVSGREMPARIDRRNSVLVWLAQPSRIREVLGLRVEGQQIVVQKFWH